MEKLEKMEKKGSQVFHRYKNDEKGKPLCIKLPKLSRYPNSFKENKMHVLFDQRRWAPKNTSKYGIKSAVNHYVIKNARKLKS